MFCPNCGKENPQNSSFCQRCGSPIGQAPNNQQNQQQFQTPPQYQQPPMQPPVKKKKKGCAIVALVLLGVFIALVILGAILSNTIGKDNPDKTTASTAAPRTIQLAISDASISENIIGENEINLIVKNTSDYTIDAFDFKVEAFNTYGEKLNNWGVSSFTKTDFTLGAGAESSPAKWTMHFVDSATSFKVTLTRYHIKETNETVNIKDGELVWVEVHK